jgi:Lhr-like helicase
MKPGATWDELAQQHRERHREIMAKFRDEATAMYQLWQQGKAPRAFELGIVWESLRREPERRELEQFRKQRGDSGAEPSVTAEAVVTALLETSASHPADGITNLIERVSKGSSSRWGKYVTTRTLKRRYAEALERFVPSWIRWAKDMEAVEGSAAARQKRARQAAAAQKGQPPSILDLRGWDLLKALHARPAAGGRNGGRNSGKGAEIQAKKAKEQGRGIAANPLSRRK